MTQEEKAKAYDEALEKAKAHINSKGIGDTVDLCKHLFSELLESEDERIRKAIIRSIEEDSSVYEQEVSKEQMLAWLEKQQEPKPTATLNGEPIHTENQSVDIPLAEWSEEDADILNCCISSIEEAKENRYAYKETDGDTSYDHEIAWLKSLRPCPSWKPSEEQMEALERFIRSWGESGTMSPQNPILCAATSLLTDLNKLL